MYSPGPRCEVLCVCVCVSEQEREQKSKSAKKREDKKGWNDTDACLSRVGKKFRGHCLAHSFPMAQWAGLIIDRSMAYGVHFLFCLFYLFLQFPHSDLLSLSHNRRKILQFDGEGLEKPFQMSWPLDRPQWRVNKSFFAEASCNVFSMDTCLFCSLDMMMIWYDMMNLLPIWLKSLSASTFPSWHFGKLLS